jgi:CDGSH-type Zn-finger protein
MMATKITVKNNGSVHVEGDFEVFDITGKKFDLDGRTAVSLCRCGHSKDKPFCDGAHREAGFHSEITARSLPPLTPKA